MPTAALKFKYINLNKIFFNFEKYNNKKKYMEKISQLGKGRQCDQTHLTQIMMAFRNVKQADSAYQAKPMWARIRTDPSI